jgi:hypothetical protein
MKVLPVEYFAQNDNELWDGVSGSVQCGPTANAMLAFYLNRDRLKRSKELGYLEPESYYKYLMTLEGFTASDRGNHDAHTVVLSKYFRIDSTWRTDLTPEDFTRSIDRGFPVVCGLTYKVSGHVAIAVGYSIAGLLIHDSYGVRLGCSDEYEEINPGYGNLAGKEDGYSWDSLDRILFNGGGWGRIVQRVRT